jgi:hypothetical protein
MITQPKLPIKSVGSSSSSDDDDFVDVSSPSNVKGNSESSAIEIQTKNVSKDEDSSSEDDFIDVIDPSVDKSSASKKVVDVNDESSSEGDFISDNEEESDDKNSPDDLFGDIFKSEENTSKLDEILTLSTKAFTSKLTESVTSNVDKKPLNEVVSISLADITKGVSNEEDDFFADVFDKVKFSTKFGPEIYVIVFVTLFIFFRQPTKQTHDT